MPYGQMLNFMLLSAIPYALWAILEFYVVISVCSEISVVDYSPQRTQSTRRNIVSDLQYRMPCGQMLNFMLLSAIPYALRAILGFYVIISVCSEISVVDYSPQRTQSTRRNIVSAYRQYRMPAGNN